MSLDDEKKILSLWKSNEKKRFGEILREFNKKLPPTKSNYDHKQINRCLKRLIKYRLLCKYQDQKGPYYVPIDAPLVREYSLSRYFDNIRDYATKKGWFMDHDIGLISGITRIGFYGIPATNAESLTPLESDILGTLGLQLRQTFQKYQLLCIALAVRMKEQSTRKPYSFYEDLFHNYIFNLMVEQGKADLLFWDDIGIEELLSMVPDYLDFMSQMREKYGWKGKHQIKDNAIDSARKLLEFPSDLSHTNDVPLIDFESFDPDMLALVATHSPRVLDEYASRPENRIMDFWTKSDGSEFTPDEINEILELEKNGIDIYEEQKRRGICDEDMCFGLEDLSIYFTASPYQRGINAFKIRLDDDIVSRLKKWQWLLERIGHEGIGRLVELVKLRDSNILRT